MSVSLTGFFFPFSLDETYQRLAPTRPLVASLVHQKLSRELLTRAAAIVDRSIACNAPTEGSEAPLSFARQQMEEERRSDALHPSSDSTLILTLLPAPPEGTLVLVQTHTPAWVVPFGTLGGARFDYWDATDPEDGTTPADWAKRKHLWTQALHPDWIPANHGLTMTFDGFFSPPRMEAVMDFIPTKAQRIDAIARELATLDFFLSNSEAPIGQMIAFLHSADGATAIAAQRTRLKSLLPPLTLALLQHGPTFGAP